LGSSSLAAHLVAVESVVTDHLDDFGDDWAESAHVRLVGFRVKVNELIEMAVGALPEGRLSWIPGAICFASDHPAGQTAVAVAGDVGLLGPGERAGPLQCGASRAEDVKGKTELSRKPGAPVTNRTSISPLLLRAVDLCAVRADSAARR